jgi:TPR repeat protein
MSPHFFPARTFLFALASCLLLVRHAHAETRVALVIGNANYAHAGVLANPLHDADAIAQALKSVGFQVDERKDLDAESFRKALLSFTLRAQAADVAVIYFAGHGMQLDGLNYLVPIDAAMASPLGINLETISATDMLNAAEPARRLRLVIIDACRDNPFKNQFALLHRSIERGLAPIAIGGFSDTLVAYSAKDGTTAQDGRGTNSPYALALARHIAEPGVELDKILREVHDDVFVATGHAQEPAVYGARSAADFFFVPSKPIPQETASLGDASALNQVSEAQLWPRLRALDTAAGYNIYTALFPNGLHYSDAAMRRSALSSAPKAEAAASPYSARAAIASLTDNDWAGGSYAAIAAKVLAQTSIGDLRVLADDGDTIAELVAWSAYDAGVGTTQDKTEASHYLTKAAEGGNANAEFILAHLIENDLDGPRNYPLAATWYQKAVDQNYGPAEINLGNMYLYGSSVPRDYHKALDLYKKAAAWGISVAFVNIGYLYDQGFGVDRSDAEALRWFHKVETDSIAQRFIGLHLLEGRGVEKDPKTAVEWLRKAATQGDTAAQYDLGTVYLGGWGIPEDRIEARKWMTAAAAGEVAEANRGDDSSVKDAKKWLRENPN